MTDDEPGDQKARDRRTRTPEQRLVEYQRAPLGGLINEYTYPQVA